MDKINIRIKEIEVSSFTLIEGDTRFKCDHELAEVEYDVGGDGITEPGPSYSVYCGDCRNEQLEQYEVDAIVEAYVDNMVDAEAEACYV